MKRWFFPLILFISFLTAYAGTETENWREDLQYLAEQLPAKHPNAFHAISREDFLAAVHKLNEQIPNLTRSEIIVGIMHIVAMIGDGHTSLSPLHDPSPGFHYLPLQLYLYADGLFVQKAAPEFKDLTGARVVSIGNATAEQAVKSIAEITPHDNEMGIRSFGPLYLMMPEILHGLGFIPDEQNVKFVFELNGQRFERVLHPAGLITPNYFGFLTNTDNWPDASFVKQSPLYLRDRHNPYWYEYLPGTKILYVQYNEVRNKEDESLAQFCNRVFAFVEEHPVDKFVLDLRFNLGGNNYFNKPILLGLIQSRKINQVGKLYVIIGRNTFSAAQNLVNEIEKYTNAIFAGEPTAQNVNFYGDHEPVILPNSKIPVLVSTLWWQNMDPRDHRKWTAPQIEADLTSTDYRNGIDPVMEAVVKCSYVSLADALKPALFGKDPLLLRKTLLSLREDPSHKCMNIEREVNSLGYSLLSTKPDLAIEVFKMNVETFPASANVYDSLGEAYLKTGNRELAIVNYRKALELNPNNSGARKILDEFAGH